MTKTITPQVLVTSQSNAASGTVRGRLDASAADGGMLRWRMTNGASGPSVECVARVMMARKQASMPAAAAQGTADDDWKIVYQQGGGLANNASTVGSYRFGQEGAYYQVEFTGNTSQAVTVECTGDTYVN